MGILKGLVLAGAIVASASAANAQVVDLWPASSADLGQVKWSGLVVAPYFGYEQLKLTGAGREGLRDPKGWRLGGEIGYDYEINHVVIGAAADAFYTWYDGAGTASNPGFNTRLTDYGTLRGRLGYAFDRVMIYGTGGYAFGDLSVKNSAAGLSESKTLSGWTAGAGIDYAYRKNMFVRFELAHISLDQTTFTSVPTGQQKLGADLDLFKLNLISHF